MFQSLNFYLLRQLVVRNIQQRFRGSFLGWLWSLLLPLIMLGVYTFVFGNFFKARWGLDLGENKMVFALALFAGLTLYNCFSESIGAAVTSVPSNINYVKKVRFPLECLPLSHVLSSFLLALPWFLLLLIAGAAVFGQVSWAWLLLPFALLPFLLFTAGLAFFTASLGVYFRDLQYLVGALLQMFFFLSPIFYRLKNLPEHFQTALLWNPLVWFIELCRTLFFLGALPDYTTLPSATEWFVSYLFGISSFLLGGVWFMKTKRGFSDVL